VAIAQPAPAAPVPTPPAGEPAPPPATEPARPAEPPAAPPEQPAKAEGEALTVRYDKGIEFATEGGAFSAKLSLRNQLRFESTRPTEDGAEFENHVYIARSRFGIDGNAFGKDNRYKVELAFGDKGTFTFIKDLYVDKTVGPARVRIGQWKRPFNRQEIVSDFSSQLNERANTADFVGGGRDLGVAVHNGYEQSPEGIEWAVGVFNGFSGGADRPRIATTCTADTTGAIACTTPAPTAVPGDWGPAVVARVGWNSKGIKGYSEADLEGGPLRYAVAVSYKIDLANFSQGKESSKVDNMSHGLEADAMIKIEGFSVELGAYMMKLKSADAKLGALVQAGMFVLPRRAEVAARFAIASTTGDRNEIEARGAFNWYWEGHRWKWASDLGMTVQTGTDPVTMEKDDPDLQLRSMAQMTF
jgi:hypothetical protein